VDLIRRNTDYALRMTTALAAQYDAGKVLSARTLSGENHVPYTLACKLLQKYQQAGIVKSTMGPRGGFSLARRPSEITLLELIETIQGNVQVNRCLVGQLTCSLRERCPLHPKLADLQEEIQRYLRNTTLAELLKTPENNSLFRTGQE
jgi:Rrf2 family transcriptional regulator, iron-sulfur cluster assembly transcription factor